MMDLDAAGAVFSWYWDGNWSKGLTQVECRDGSLRCESHGSSDGEAVV